MLCTSSRSLARSRHLDFVLVADSPPRRHRIGAHHLDLALRTLYIVSRSHVYCLHLALCTSRTASRFSRILSWSCASRLGHYLHLASVLPLFQSRPTLFGFVASSKSSFVPMHYSSRQTMDVYSVKRRPGRACHLSLSPFVSEAEVGAMFSPSLPASQPTCHRQGPLLLHTHPFSVIFLSGLDLSRCLSITTMSNILTPPTQWSMSYLLSFAGKIHQVMNQAIHSADLVVLPLPGGLESGKKLQFDLAESARTGTLFPACCGRSR